MFEGKQNSNFKRDWRAMAKAICGVELLDKKRTEHLVGMLELEESMEQLQSANGVHWYGHALKRDWGIMF